MVYVVGIIGFIGGFALGQLVLYYLLRNRSTEELLNNKLLRLQYGIINWVFAAFGAFCMVQAYEAYFSY